MIAKPSVLGKGNLHGGVVLARGNTHAAVAICGIDGITKQIGEHGAQLLRPAHQRGHGLQIHVHLDLTSIPGFEQSRYVVDQVVHVRGLDFGHVQVGEPLHAGDDLFQSIR
jgi:hypothetical protein